MKFRETTAGSQAVYNERGQAVGQTTKIVTTTKMTPRGKSPARIAANKEWQKANGERIKTNMSR